MSRIPTRRLPSLPSSSGLEWRAWVQILGRERHPDDDECTFRRDGTDATYCGRREHEHKESLR